MRATLEEKQVDLFVIGSETLGYNDFLDLNLVPRDKVFIDLETVLFKAFATPLRFSDVMSGLLTTSMWSRLYNSTISGNMVVSKNQYYMDTLLVLTGEKGEVVHSQTLAKLADPFNFDALLEAVDKVKPVAQTPQTAPSTATDASPR